MSDKEKAEYFEQFPRRDLSFCISRRELFGLLSTELRISQEESQGITGFTLASLGSASDDCLAQVIPVIDPECRVSVTDGWIWGQLPTITQPEKLFPAETAVTCAFNQFNGRNDLGEAGYHLARELGWEEKRAFALVRGLFLHLVQHHVCRPQ